MPSKFEGGTGSPLLNICGRARLTLLGVLACSLLVFGFLLLIKTPAQAFVSKGTSCSATTCHGASEATATISVALNGTQGTAITVSPGSTFEVDWLYTNLRNTTKYDGTNPEIAIPTGWTVTRGTSNSPSLSGWSNTWDQTCGVIAGWNTSYSTSGEFPNSPLGYAIDYNGTAWDNGNRDAAFDNGSAGDLDGVANKMGADARITVPAGATPGTYTVMVLGIGHNSSDTKAHIEQAITVTVSSGISQTITVGTPAPSSAAYNSQFTVAATASSGLPVSYSSGSTSICTNSGATFTMVSGTGTCIVQYDQAGGSGYAAAPRVTNNVTATKINQATVTVSAPASATYGQTGLSATASGGSGTGAYSYSAGSSTACTVNSSSGALTITSGTGTCDITATRAADSNYNVSATSTAASVAVNKAPLTVTAAAKSKTYGGVDPALTYTSSGFVNGDTSAIMSGSLTRAPGENVGIYSINQGTVSAGNNYTISYTGANLSINTAPLTVTAEAKSRTYGGVDPALTYTTSGFVNGDTSAIMTGNLTRVAGENVSAYAINQGTVAATSNYTIAYTGANLTINAAPLAVNAEAKSKTYGGVDPALTYTASGFVNGDTSAIMTGSLTRAAGENVGAYAINQGTVAASNYTITYTASNLTINAAPLAVNAEAKSKTYGGVDPALTYTATGFVNGDTSAIMSGSLTRAAGENVGAYAINQGTVAASNYTITYTASNLTINAAPLAVNAEAKSKTYGGTDPALTYAASGFVNGDTTAIMTGSLTRVAGENTGNYAISQGTVAATSNYTITYTAANLTINTAPLTVTAEAKSKTYGAVDPALTYNASGFVNGDTSAIMSGSLARAAGENVGAYAINQATVAATSNYTVSYTGANLTINTAPLTVTAEAKSKTYGAADPALTYNASGFVNGDTSAIMTGSLTRVAGENVGTYAVNQATVAATSNYTITYTGANLTIDPAPLTVTAEAKSKTYGGTDPALTYNASGFANGDTVAIMTGGLTRITGENVGSYAINQGTVAATSNYTVSYTGANLTIDPAPLSVTAEAKSKAYGAADPALTYTATGLVNGDTSAIMTGSLTRVAGENIGTYAINQGTVAATGNYTVSYTGANLAIDQASLTVTAEAKSKTYGGTDPALTYTATGFVNGDTIAIMSGTLTRAAGESAGNYAINQGSVAATGNYTLSYTGANLTIDTATLSVTANNQTKTQGSVNPPLTITYSGFVNGDDETSLTTQPTATTTATTESPAGPYPIIPDGGVSSNYTFNYVVGTLTVTAAGNPRVNMTVNGNGSVNSNPAGIACSNGGGSCGADFTSGQQVELTATPSWNYDFTGWSGAFTSSVTPYTVVVTSLTDVIATFTAKQLVKLPGGNYPSLQDAYSAANEGETMQLRDQMFPENLDFNRTVQVKLDGGWNDDYTAVIGSTTIDGTVTITSGGITVSNVIIQ